MSVRRRWRSACTIPCVRAAMTHVPVALLPGLLKLLLLSIGHQRFQLLMRIRHRRMHLLMAFLRAQAGVAADRLHLLLLVLQDGQHLLLLIGGQVQRLC